MEASANVIIPQKAWADLQLFLEGEDLPENAMAELTRLGFFEDGDFADVARKLLAAYREPIGYVQLLINDGGLLRHAVAWIDEGRRSCVAQVLDDSVAISSYEASEFPIVMIDLLDIGPRPAARPMATASVPKEWALELLETSKGEARSRIASEMGTFWPEARAAMLEGDWKLWAAYSRPATETTDVRGSICVLDTSKGYFSVVLEEDSAIIRPVSSLQVWCGVAQVVAPAA